MEAETRRHASMSALLRERRHELHPNSTTLGVFERHPNRIGKPVTQEEVAEAAGVTRVWYALLEGTANVHASPALVLRLADVLMLDDAERTALLYAAIAGPEATR
jgi:hypothetical protein